MLKSSLTNRNRDGIELANLPKVKLFLDSVGRNSLKSKTNYFTGLRHLNNYVNKAHDCDIKSILTPLSKSQINVYDLLDSFISYLLERKGIAPGSTQMYVALTP